MASTGTHRILVVSRIELGPPGTSVIHLRPARTWAERNMMGYRDSVWRFDTWTPPKHVRRAARVEADWWQGIRPCTLDRLTRTPDDS